MGNTCYEKTMHRVQEFLHKKNLISLHEPRNFLFYQDIHSRDRIEVSMSKIEEAKKKSQAPLDGLASPKSRTLGNTVLTGF